jgi:hypothetical protein
MFFKKVNLFLRFNITYNVKTDENCIQNTVEAA